MNTTALVHFAKSTFWTIDRHSKAHAMRRYRSLWRGLDSQLRWKLECSVYKWRSLGLSEDVIEEMIEVSLNVTRPWRLSNAKLTKLFKCTSRH